MTGARDNRGRPYPLGATVCTDGTNFSIFSASASGMQLVLFDHADDRVAARTITLDPVGNRTSHYWHIFLSGIKPGQLYGYRADGPFDPAVGQRFDPHKVLIDPYGKGVSVNSYWKSIELNLPPLPGKSSRWIRMIDTSLGSPDDIAEVEKGSAVVGSTYVVHPHSIVMLHFALHNEATGNV